MTIKTEIDENRPIPGGMRHWMQKAGIYPSKRFGLHRAWRRWNTFHGRTHKERFVEGTRDQVRHFRLLPHLDRMDICDGFFDRWANSLGASVQMPKTEAEFNAALATLLKKAAARVAETHGGEGDAY